MKLVQLCLAATIKMKAIKTTIVATIAILQRRDLTGRIVQDSEVTAIIRVWRRKRGRGMGRLAGDRPDP